MKIKFEILFKLGKISSESTILKIDIVINDDAPFLN